MITIAQSGDMVMPAGSVRGVFFLLAACLGLADRVLPQGRRFFAGALVGALKYKSFDVSGPPLCW
jgi:hypothetical protein